MQRRLLTAAMISGAFAAAILVGHVGNPAVPASTHHTRLLACGCSGSGTASPTVPTGRPTTTTYPDETWGWPPAVGPTTIPDWLSLITTSYGNS